MNFKKSLKRNQKKRGQVMLEYVILLAAAILAIVAVNFWVELRGGAGSGFSSGFERHFRQIAGPAGGLSYVE